MSVEPENKREWVLDQLPGKAADLFLNIEKHQPDPIVIGLRPPLCVTDPNPDAPACKVENRGGRILFGSYDTFTVEGCIHELLHLERWIIERQPQIVPAVNDPNNWQITGEIENVLEHQAVIPQESDYAAHDPAYWESTFDHNWRRLNRVTFNDWALRKGAMLAYLNIGLVDSPALTDLAEQKLAAFGMLSDAREFRQTVKKFGSDKARQINVTCRAINLPKQEVRLVSFKRNGGFLTKNLL